MSDDKTSNQTDNGLSNAIPSTVKKSARKKKATCKKLAVQPGDQVAILFVKCKKDHFHRAGIRWVKNGFGVLVSDLTDDQIDAIMGEPMLMAAEGSINADALEGIVRVNQD